VKVGSSGRWEVAGKGYGRVNAVKKCMYMYVNAKMIPIETIPGIRGGEIKENGGGGESKYDTFGTL
jgi:hypothetical protein